MTYVSPECVENVRWGRGVHAIDHPSTILAGNGIFPNFLHHAAFQDLSRTCIMIKCCKVGFGEGGPEDVFRW